MNGNGSKGNGKLTKAQREVLGMALAWRLNEVADKDAFEYSNEVLLDAHMGTLRALERRGLVIISYEQGYWLTDAAFELDIEPDFAALDAEAEARRLENLCPRCGGSGIIGCYVVVNGGLCWVCNGTGRKR